MTAMSLFGDVSVFSMPLERTLVYALWYATLFWLPVRGAAAVIDLLTGRHHRHQQPRLHPHMHARMHSRVHPQMLDHLTRRQSADQRADNYRVGMDILPPI